MSDPDYELYQDGAKTRARLRSGEEVCDFCMTPNPTWDYPAGEMQITVHHVITNSDDNWGACDECHRLIEANYIDMLVDRCIEVQMQLHPPGDTYTYPPIQAMRSRLKLHFRRFMSARTGPATRYEPVEHD